MKNAYCQEVIISNLLQRGDGKIGNPYRSILQVYDKNGTLIAEHDPEPDTFTKEQMIDFAQYCRIKNTEVIHETAFKSWQESKLPF